jgi:hypothetical protein
MQLSIQITKQSTFSLPVSYCQTRSMLISEVRILLNTSKDSEMSSVICALHPSVTVIVVLYCKGFLCNVTRSH